MVGCKFVVIRSWEQLEVVTEQVRASKISRYCVALEISAHSRVHPARALVAQVARLVTLDVHTGYMCRVVDPKLC